MVSIQVAGVEWKEEDQEIVSAVAAAIVPPLFWVSALLLHPRFRALLNSGKAADVSRDNNG
jgi:hypothetical protein